MKKILALLLTLVMIFCLTACGGGSAEQSDTAAPTGDEIEYNSSDAQVIGIAMPTKSRERWNRDGSYLKEEFEAAGYQVDLIYSNDDITQQNNDICNMIVDGVDLLIIAAIDGEALGQVLADAEAAGIPVIAYDRLIRNTDAVSYYVSFDNYTVGTLQGRYVEQTLELANAPEGTVYNIEFTAGDPADNNARYFYAGVYDVLAPYIQSGVLNVVSGQTEFREVTTAQWDTDAAMARMQDILASFYSDGTVLDVAVCSNDSTALGVSQAISSDYAGENQPIITGQDGDIANLINIVDGKQSMTVFKNVANEAVVTLELAKAILNGETPAEDLLERISVECAYDTEIYDNGAAFIPSYLLVPSVITADNLDELVDTGLYAWDGEYLVSVAAK